MPRYYFHIVNDFDAPDDEGRELPDLDAAKHYATVAARDLVAAGIKQDGRLILSHRIDVEDDNHRAIASVHFGDAISVQQ